MLTIGTIAARRPLTSRRGLIRRARQTRARSVATIRRGARRTNRAALRRAGRRSILQGLAGLPDGSSLADFERYMADRTTDLNAIASQTFEVGSDKEQEVGNEMDALVAEVVQGYNDWTRAGIKAGPEDWDEAERLFDKWTRLHMYALGQLEVKVTTEPPGILSQMADTFKKMGTGAMIGAAAAVIGLLLATRGKG